MACLFKQFTIIKVLVSVLTVFQLTACGGGGQGSAAAGGSAQVNNGPPSSSNLSLSWSAPVTRADGSPISLADIGGYKIYLGTSAGNYTDSVDVTDGSQTSVTITGLTGGTYHLVMTTYDANGLESTYSPEVLKTAL